MHHPSPRTRGRLRRVFATSVARSRRRPAAWNGMPQPLAAFVARRAAPAEFRRGLRQLKLEPVRAGKRRHAPKSKLHATLGPARGPARAAAGSGGMTVTAGARTDVRWTPSGDGFCRAPIRTPLRAARATCRRCRRCRPHHSPARGFRAAPPMPTSAPVLPVPPSRGGGCASNIAPRIAAPRAPSSRRRRADGAPVEHARVQQRPARKRGFHRALGRDTALRPGARRCRAGRDAARDARGESFAEATVTPTPRQGGEQQRAAAGRGATAARPRLWANLLLAGRGRLDRSRRGPGAQPAPEFQPRRAARCRRATPEVGRTTTLAARARGGGDGRRGLWRAACRRARRGAATPSDADSDAARPFGTRAPPPACSAAAWSLAPHRRRAAACPLDARRGQATSASSSRPPPAPAARGTARSAAAVARPGGHAAAAAPASEVTRARGASADPRCATTCQPGAERPRSARSAAPSSPSRPSRRRTSRTAALTANGATAAHVDAAAPSPPRARCPPPQAVNVVAPAASGVGPELRSRGGRSRPRRRHRRRPGGTSALRRRPIAADRV